LTNPLKKLYHEKRDESEKNRFAIPKKHSGDPFPPKEDKHTEKKAHDRFVGDLCQSTLHRSARRTL
jgi:hypothetical protein